MTERKYDKYFIKYGLNTPVVPDSRPILARMDDDLAKGSNFYLIHWVEPGFADILETTLTRAPPHIHKYAELLIHVGNDPKNPMDLGARRGMYMGRNWSGTFTESTIWIRRIIHLRLPGSTGLSSS